MSSLTTALSVATSAMQVQQQGMLVTSQNIANAETNGYSVQRANLTANALTYAGKVISGGVSLQSVDSTRDQLLDSRILAATSLKSSSDGLSTALSSLESLFGSLDDSNLQTQLQAVASAFNDAATSPDDDAIAASAVESLQTLTSLLNQTASGIDDLSTALTTDARSSVDEINAILGQITSTNRASLASSAAGGDAANEYGDRLSVLVEKLAGYMQINVSYDKSGAATVSCGGTLLVSGTDHVDLALSTSNDGSIHLIQADSGIRVDPTSGLLATYQDLVNEKLPGYAAQLDDVALALIDYLGTNQAIGSDGGAGSDLLVSNTVFSAEQVNQNLDDVDYDSVHGLGFATALAPDLPDSGSTSVMSINAYDADTGLASKYVLVYDAGTGSEPASRSLQDLVDAINSGSGGGFNLVPPANGDLVASLQASGGGYRLVISTSDGRTLDCGTAMDVRPTDDATSNQWATGNAGFVLSGSYDGGAAYSSDTSMTISVTTAGTIGDDDNPPTVSISIPVEKDGVVNMEAVSITLDSSHPANVPISLGNGLEIIFDTGSLAVSSDQLPIVTDASDDRAGVLGALGIDQVLVGTGARDIAVSAALIDDPTRLSTGSSRASGASDIADAMAGLLASATVPGTDTAVGTAYQRLISDIGQEISNAEAMSSTQDLAITTLENQRALTSGVDVDQQMALLIEQQQAYAAAAKVISMIRDNITTLMSILD